MNKKYNFALSLVATFVSTYAMAASNFTISPKAGTVLPTVVTIGSTVSAYYTVVNNTHSTRMNYTVQGLPATVTQNTSGGNCSNPVVLGPLASCTLRLDITGQAIGNFALCYGSSCTSATVPLNVIAISSPTPPTTILPLVAGGSYGGVAFPNIPWVVRSPDNGATWQYVLDSTTPTLPAGFSGTGGGFNTATCGGSLCMGVGAYHIAGTQYPLMGFSMDKGVTWAYDVTATTPTLPADFNSNGQFSGAACNGGSVCIGAGTYADAGAVTYPLLVQTTNSGASWSYTIDSSTLPPLFSSNGSFASASCSGSTCVAGGTYTATNTNSYPLIATTNNSGASWAYTLFNGTPALPPGYSTGGRIRGISCSGTICAAGGNYTGAGAVVYPLLATSSDSGVTWSYVTTLPADFVSAGRLNSASCSGTNCVAAGFYNNGAQVPLIMASTNGGATWSVALSGTSTLPANFVSGSFLNSTCNGSTCLAVGSYSTTTLSNQPFAATSHDGGLTWSYTVTTATTTLPALTIGILVSPSCSSNVCMISGFYQSGGVQYGFIGVSTDSGNTWTFPVNGTSPTLPADFLNDGAFSGTGIPAALLPHSLQAIFNNNLH